MQTGGQRRGHQSLIEGSAMPKLRVHNFSVSLDGYAAGPTQSLTDPLGVGGDRLHEWVFATRAG
jgi:hypothetical protein